MKYRVIHRTHYTYGAPVTVSHHAARVEPRATPLQRLLEWSLRIVPEPAVRKMRVDYFGNRVCFFSVQELHRDLEIVAESVVERQGPVRKAEGEGPAWERVVRDLNMPATPETLDALQYVFESPHVRPSRELAELAQDSFTPGRPLLSAMDHLNRRIHREFTFDAEATTVATPLETVLSERRGVCQDFTHLALGCLRSMGLAARYTSGYLRTFREGDRSALVGADATHAWLSVFCPGMGWVDFDPTNDLRPSVDHIAVAYGRDFSDVSPIAGLVIGGGEHTLDVAVRVEPIV
jgi:transglutaminase-like putative cysteine protease